LLLVLAALGRAAAALEPDEVLLLTRATSTDAAELIAHYRRVHPGVPSENVLGLSVAERETVGRAEFERWVLAPLRRELTKPERARIRCLLVLRGLPLRVAAAPDLDPKRAEATVASFDSELALTLRPPGTLEGWAPNPLRRPGPLLPPVPVLGPDRPLLVARIDAPTLALAHALIERAAEGEKHGLEGEFCFDARGLKGGPYGAYDDRIREAARVARAAGLRVKLDDRPELFQSGECADTSFYIGWYSLGRYVDAFRFGPGALGFHVASAECRSLRGGEFWVPQLVEHGITATLGPTDEPYLASFPDPVDFLTRVIEGRRTLAEIYWETVPHASWRQVLVGDPLYRPHLAAPR
jgi:uncharacterized protein (TIGR03790 family)